MASWLKIAGNEDVVLEQQLEEQVTTKLSGINFTQKDLDYIARLDFTPRINSEIDTKIFCMLRELCTLCDAKPKQQKITSHRKYSGPFIVLAKKCLFAVFGAFLKSRDEQQRKFNSQVLQILLKLAEKK